MNTETTGTPEWEGIILSHRTQLAGQILTAIISREGVEFDAVLKASQVNAALSYADMLLALEQSEVVKAKGGA